MIKKWVCAFFALLVMAVSLSGCDTNQQAGSKNWDNKASYYLQGTVSDKGYYYLRNENVLCFLDTGSGKNAVLCGKIGCPHNDESCEGYVGFDAHPKVLFYTNEKLYTVERTEEGYQLFCRMEDGSNREKVLTLMQDQMDGNSSFAINDYRVSGNTLYYTALIVKGASESESVDKTQSLTLRRIDLATGKEEEIYRPEGSSCVLVSANEEAVLFAEMWVNDTDVTYEEYNSKEFLSESLMKTRLWSKETASVETLLEKNRWELLSAVAASGDDMYVIFWTNERTGNSVQRINMKTKESREVFSTNQKIANYAALEDERILFMIEQQWYLFGLDDFKEISLDFLPQDATIMQTTKDGYIVNRVLEKEEFEDGSGFAVLKQAYSYISKADAEKGAQNYIDFYIQTSEE